MGKSELALIAAIWGSLTCAYGPDTWRRWTTPPPPPAQTPGSGEDRYFNTSCASVIFYTTPVNLVLDTSTCMLPSNGVIPVGK
ncbi:MAG: hypothetical protein ACAI25_16595 [Planctomycetota bacterium]